MKRSFAKKTAAVMMAGAMAVSAYSLPVFAAENTNVVDVKSEIQLEAGKTYSVPASMVVDLSGMPSFLPFVGTVKTAVNSSLGNTAKVKVNEDGTRVIELTFNQIVADLSQFNMETVYGNISDFTGNYENIDITYKDSKRSEGMTGGNIIEGKSIDVLRITLPANTKEITGNATIDFMDKAYSATISLDYDNATVIEEEKPSTPTTDTDPLGISKLENGTYNFDIALWHANKDQASMAASVIKSATLSVKDGKNTVAITTQPMSMMGMTAELEKLEYEAADGTYKEAAKDGSVYTFELPSTAEYINVKVHYMGHAQDARLKLVAVGDKVSDEAITTPTEPETPTTPTEPETPTTPTTPAEEETPAVLDKTNLEDGTYSINVALWNASSDKASMAASSIAETAKLVVKDGVYTVYITTKEMTLGTISASLQEMKVKAADGSFVKATKDGSVFSFVLPVKPTAEEDIQYIDVLVNPMVAMMGNQDIAARLKIDWSKLAAYEEQAEPAVPEKEPAKDTTATDKKENAANIIKQTGAADSVSAAAAVAGLLTIGGAAVFMTRRKEEENA